MAAAHAPATAPAAVTYRQAVAAALRRALVDAQLLPQELLGILVEFMAQPKLLVCGGVFTGRPSDFFECFDPFTREWLQLTSLPRGRARPLLYCGDADSGGATITAMGGAVGDLTQPHTLWFDAQLHAYDVAVGAWRDAGSLLSAAPPPPDPDADATQTADPQAQAHEADTKSAAPAAPVTVAPLQVRPMNGVIWGDRLYLTGAQFYPAAALPKRRSAPFDADADASADAPDVPLQLPPPPAVVCVDLRDRPGVVLALLPPPRDWRVDAALCAMHARLFVVGGHTGRTPLRLVSRLEVFDCERGVWLGASNAPSPTAVTGAAAAGAVAAAAATVIDDSAYESVLPAVPSPNLLDATLVPVPDLQRVYVLGGRASPAHDLSTAVYYCQRYIASAGAAATTPAAADAPVTPRAAAAVAAAAGADAPTEWYRWSEAPATHLPAVPVSVAAVAIGQTLYVVATEVDFKALWVYHIPSGEWSQLRGMPHFRSHVSVAVWDA